MSLSGWPGRDEGLSASEERELTRKREEAEKQQAAKRYGASVLVNSAVALEPEPSDCDVAEPFFAALSSAMEREGCDAAVLVGVAECSRALPWREEYQTFGNGRRLEEAESPPFCGADIQDPVGTLARAQAQAVARAAKERRAVALIFRRGVVCRFERRPASFEPVGSPDAPPAYRAPGVSVRTRVAFIRADSRVGG